MWKAPSQYKVPQVSDCKKPVLRGTESPRPTLWLRLSYGVHFKQCRTKVSFEESQETDDSDVDGVTTVQSPHGSAKSQFPIS